eukprot:sb/3469482/
MVEINSEQCCSGTKVYVRTLEGEEQYCGDVTIPTEPDQTSSNIICESPTIGNEVVFRLQKTVGDDACIHLFEVEAYGLTIMIYTYATERAGMCSVGVEKTEGKKAHIEFMFCMAALEIQKQSDLEVKYTMYQCPLVICIDSVPILHAVPTDILCHTIARDNGAAAHTVMSCSSSNTSMARFQEMCGVQCDCVVRNLVLLKHKDLFYKILFVRYINHRYFVSRLLVQLM